MMLFFHFQMTLILPNDIVLLLMLCIASNEVIKYLAKGDPTLSSNLRNLNAEFKEKNMTIYPFKFIYNAKMNIHQTSEQI